MVILEITVDFPVLDAVVRFLIVPFALQLMMLLAQLLAINASLEHLLSITNA